MYPQITDVMTVFSLISQSLRTAEPLHQALPQSLVGRLMYHHYNHNLHKASPVRPSISSRQSKEELSVETISSLDYMYYATGIVAVFLVLRVGLFLRGVFTIVTMSFLFLVC